MAFVTLWHTRYKLRRRNHGWPWLHTVRHSMLQQVSTNKQYATRMLIIPVKKKGLINSHPAIHLFNDSFPFTSRLIYWTACSGLYRRTAQTVSLKWRDEIWADRIRLSGDCWDGQKKRDNARWKQTNLSSTYILSRFVCSYGPVFPGSPGTFVFCQGLIIPGSYIPQFYIWAVLPSYVPSSEYVCSQAARVLWF